MIDEPAQWSPPDWEAPDFSDPDRVHNWKNYASDRMKAHWGSFTAPQKMIISECLHDIANNEHWE